MPAGWLALVFAASALVCAALIRVLQPLPTRHAPAHPTGRSSQKVPTPQGGGIGVIGATVAVVIAVAVAIPGFGGTSLSLVLAGAVLIAAVGAIDDVRSIPVAPRLLLQFVAVVL